MDITIAIDDIHPGKGWGMEGDECMYYLEELNKEFGAKFTLFIPSNYHYQAPLSEHKDWVEWLKSKGYFELAAHGHFHQTSDKAKWGECEFAEINSKEECEERLNMLWKEWNAVGHKPKGWRNPGWLAQPVCISVLGKQFEYAAIHYEHNRGFQWDCKTLFGHDGIHETDITLHLDRIMFQSHIAGDWNHNVWNQTNYNQLRSSLQYLTQNYEHSFKTLYECI